MTTAAPPRACVIGHPIAHSRSPLIHSYWLNHYGLPGSYGREDVTPDGLAAFVHTLQARGYGGCNVTLPHKEAAYHLVQKTMPRADLLKAVNTLWFENGVLWGDNSDITGFLANLDECSPGWDRSLNKAVVLGAGGASAAIIAGLLERDARQIVVVNRSLDRAEHLRERFGDIVQPMGWQNIEEALQKTDLLVNTTSLGMKDQPPLTIDLSLMPKTALVTDIVYIPLETDLLRVARERGHPVVDGLGMLLHQAGVGFEHWFGIRPEVTPELRALVEADVLAIRS